MQGDALVMCPELAVRITSVPGILHPILRGCFGTATSPKPTYLVQMIPSPGPSGDLHTLNHRLNFAITL